MPSPLTHDDPQAFGPYRPIARLGSGGMGTVYLARTAGGRTVALKTMHARLASDPAFRTRFRLETDAVRVVGERFGAGVVDADPRAETPWFATEYVLGPPLDEAVELCGPLPEASVRALGAALCGALRQLHASDVVHRDLKPSNILITAYGPKVIDFGIARAAGDDHLTRVGVAVGTPAFMSPEQAGGQEHTTAGDVFALAGLLVFAATGRPPFGHGQAADLLYRVQYAEPDLSGVPDSLVPLLAQCLDKNPFRRPTTEWLASRLHDGAGEFADHLPGALLADIGRRASEVWTITPQRLPAPAEEAEIAVPTPAARISRRRLLCTVGGAALSAAGAGAGVWAWSQHAGSGPNPQPGPSNSLLPKKKLDSVWQIQVADPPDDTIPAQLHVVENLVTLVAGRGLGGIVAQTGHVQFASDQMESTWQVATDGKRLIRLVQKAGAENNAGKPGGFPLLLASVDLLTGKASDLFAEFTDFNGVLPENQLVCTADGVAYVAAGRGNFSDEGFLASQSWYLFAVDISSGKRLWTAPLPARRQGSIRLYFLSAAVVGRHLVTLQEANDGTVRAVVRDTRTGAVRWDRPLDGIKPDRVRQSMAVDAQQLYVGTTSLRALRLSDGGLAWDTQSGRPGAIFGPPLVKDDIVYAVQKERGLVCLTANGGMVMWEERGGQGAQADVTVPPVMGPNYMYNKRGSELWAIAWQSTHEPVRSFKTTGDRFIAHEKSGRVIALGGKFLAAFPLQ
ncbi:protein kinase domain-containing protein [Streptomyces camelliae]|uniref:Protein kinase n=1 Tax=Streptomyces camelliae TaxID=3004093 RepID=A0ABY7P155_9ACTN|nr:serine/threonine-protein kinase [Streptomyces sp. HUAS 2-6]WBO63467.1 protein kinase [Streptomyces sp. HUAS 2-6]